MTPGRATASSQLHARLAVGFAGRATSMGMRWTSASRTLLVLVGMLALPATGSSLATPSAAAALPSAPPVLVEETAAEAFARELARDPVGVVIGNEIHRPDGAVFVAVDAGTLSLSQCTSGRWCMWDETNYQGSFSYRTGSGGTYLLSGTVHSVFNNRGAAARLFSNTSATSTCYVAGAKSASVSASYYTAEKVRLLAGGC